MSFRPVAFRKTTMAPTTASPAATPVRVINPRAFIPTAVKPAVRPATSAGTSPSLRNFPRPTSHSIPRAMQVLIAGMNRAK